MKLYAKTGDGGFGIKCSVSLIPKPSTRHFLGTAIIAGICLSHLACVVHPSKNISSAAKMQRFFKNTLLIKEGMRLNQVKSIMGKPDIIITTDESKILSRCRSDKVYLYYHPEYATVHFIVGIGGGRVTRAAFWKEWGTRLPIEGHLVDVLEFWTQEMENMGSMSIAVPET